MRRILALTLATAGLLAAVASAQEKVPETGAEVVRLDVVVTERDGKPVRELTRQDFQLLEDGKPQVVANFLAVTRPPRVPQPQAAATPGQPGSPGRAVVIFVDDLHLAPGHLDHTKEALHQFAASYLSPEDRVAVVTSSGPGGVQELTQDRAALAAAIDHLALRQATVAPALGSQMTPVQAELILRGDASALQLATRLMKDEPGSVVSGQGPQAAVEAAGGANPASVFDAGDRGAAREVLRQARGILAEDLRFSEITLAQVEDVLRSLAPLAGRKICLLVSDGFLVGMGTSDERTRQMRSVVDAATRSGAVVYALDAHGLTTTGGDSSAAGAPVPSGLRERVDRLAAQELRETLSALAGDTGGFLLRNTNELGQGLQRMLEDDDAYYLMAYQPANTKHDGKFRRIEVRLPGRPGLVVRTRKGYLAPDDRRRDADRGAARQPARVAAPAPVIDEKDARAALGAPLPTNGVPVGLVVDYVDLPPTGGQAIVRAHVNLAGASWRQQDGHRRLDLDLLGGVYDEYGMPVGSSFGKRFALDLVPEDYERAVKAGLQYQNRVALAPGRFEVRAVVRQPGGEVVGGAVQPLEVPDLKQGKLALSSVFLSTSAGTPPAGTTAPAAGEAETLRDVQMLRRFGAGDRLYFQLYVYNVPDAAADVVLQAQILSAGKPIAASQPQPVTALRKDGVPLPQSSMMSLQGLTAGRYRLRIVVQDRATKTTVHRDVDFTVD